MRSKMKKNWFIEMRDYQSWQAADGKSEKTSSGRVEASLKYLRALLERSTTTCDGIYKLGQFDVAYSQASCYQLWNHHSSTVERIQALCPVGCGCYSPWFGTIYKNRQGCNEYGHE